MVYWYVKSIKGNGFRRVKYLEGIGNSYINSSRTCFNITKNISTNFNFKIHVPLSTPATATPDSLYFSVGTYQKNLTSIYRLPGRMIIFCSSSSGSAQVDRSDTKTYTDFEIIGSQKSIKFGDAYTVNGSGQYVTGETKMTIYANHGYYGDFTIADDGWEYNYLVGIDGQDRPCCYCVETGEFIYNAGAGEFGYETFDGMYVAPVSV